MSSQSGVVQRKKATPTVSKALSPEERKAAAKTQLTELVSGLNKVASELLACGESSGHRVRRLANEMLSDAPVDTTPVDLEITGDSDVDKLVPQVPFASFVLGFADGKLQIRPVTQGHRFQAGDVFGTVALLTGVGPRGVRFFQSRTYMAPVLAGREGSVERYVKSKLGGLVRGVVARAVRRHQNRGGGGDEAYGDEEVYDEEAYEDEEAYGDEADRH